MKIYCLFCKCANERKPLIFLEKSKEPRYFTVLVLVEVVGFEPDNMSVKMQ